MEQHEYLSLQQLVKSGHYPFSMGQIRHIMLHRHKNGLQNAVRRVGKRLLLRRDLWESWIESKQEDKR
jgi:hypothetical protein